MTSLVARVVARSVAVLIGALIAVGVGTGALLYALELRSVDQALLAAATAYGHRGGMRAEHAWSPVRVGWADELGARPEWIEDVLRHERPRWIDTPEHRVLLVLVEQETEEERHDQHRVVLAYVDRPTVAHAVGGFAVAYTIAGGLVAAGAGLAQRRLARGAVRPLHDAVRVVEQATASSMGTRLAVRGPDEVRALLAAVDALLARRDDAYRAQTRFSAAAAHELRTPVTALLGEIDLALRRPRDADAYRATLVTARDETRRLGALVEGLLLLARVDAGQAEQNRAREHLSALIDAAVRRERPRVVERGGAVRIELPVDPEVEVHEALVVAALANLVRNAAVHAPGATVTVSTELREDRVAIVVADDGPGFAAPPTFERRPEGGLGLGLPLTREVARRHGGDCVIEPRPRGAAVALLLPLPTQVS